MRHKLLYLLALALTATSSGWGQDADTFKPGSRKHSFLLRKR